MKRTLVPGAETSTIEMAAATATGTATIGEAITMTKRDLMEGIAAQKGIEGTVLLGANEISALVSVARRPRTEDLDGIEVLMRTRSYESRTLI